jgi:hypothetical protein
MISSNHVLALSIQNLLDISYLKRKMQQISSCGYWKNSSIDRPQVLAISCSNSLPGWQACDGGSKW